MDKTAPTFSINLHVRHVCIRCRPFAVYYGVESPHTLAKVRPVQYRNRIRFVPLLFILLFALSAMAVSPNRDEKVRAIRWAEAKLENDAVTNPFSGCLIASFKSGRLLKNSATTQVYYIDVGAAPLRIGDHSYSCGLYCPSEGHVIVRLPEPARLFEGVVGVDSTRATSFYSNAGRGAVVAKVLLNGKDLFHSPVMHEGMAGIPVKVNLDGTKEFTLEISGRSEGVIQQVDFNQADWADARVTLMDGKTVWLGNLPIAPLRSNYSPDAPFSFWYDGHPSSEFLKGWKVKRTIQKMDANRVLHTVTYVDPITGLEVRCLGIVYQDFPVVEWTVYFKNTGNKPTPMLQRIEAIDTSFERNNEGEFVLHYNKGSPHSMVRMGGPTDYEPLRTQLGPEDKIDVGGALGLPAVNELPFFNCAWNNQGVILAVGWPGQWAGTFRRNADRTLHLTVGQQTTRLKLLPGEQVRTPRISVLFYDGDWMRGQNLWRRWMMAHNMPRIDGHLPAPQIAASSSAYYVEMAEADENSQINFINDYFKEGVDFDDWWVDAGWQVFKGYWLNIGTWEPDPERFPQGLRPISDYLHKRGKKMILWFAPEAVTPDTFIYTNYPGWLLGDKDDRFKLFNLGDPAARVWLTDYIDKDIKENGVDVYRHDGIPPLSYWRSNDTTNRQGITENRYVRGFLKYFDELQKSNPHMLIDICCGGGGRIDLSTLRRAVPLWRDDYAYDPTGMQNETYGMALWVPYFGTGVNKDDLYTCRSQMTPALSCIWDLRNKNLNYQNIKTFLSEWRQVAPDYYGDFYPLTVYRPENDVWMAWQFNRPEAGTGMIQAFRRPKCDIVSMRLKLRGLDPSARYSVTNYDESSSEDASGASLMENGLLISLKKCPDSVLISYNRLN